MSKSTTIRRSPDRLPNRGDERLPLVCADD
jgi:hypothetical protein